MPDCLATLTALRALNLSNCMIESLHPLTRNPPLAVTALNLRANRLVSIAGIEGMVSLERLDLRDNRIQDPTELARLTGSPRIHELYVLRNPFVRTHSNYRVTIFNLFRATSGYTEDIAIDSSLPSYSERRQLRDRAPEPERAAEAKPTPIEPFAELAQQALLQATSPNGADIQGVQRPPLQATQSEFAVGSARKRKGTRRRIVDLARDQSPPRLHQPSSMDMPQQFSRPGLATSFSDDLVPKSKRSLPPPLEVHSEMPLPQQLRSMELPHHLPLDLSDRGRTLAAEIQSLNLRGKLNPNAEEFRQKIEAFKDEVGSKWLSMVPELKESYHVNISTPTPFFNHVSLISPEAAVLRPSSQSIASGTRTLG